MPQIITTDGDTGRRIEALNEAVRRLRAGRLVAIPTETVYGLAADATIGEAVAGIFAAKGRPAFNPLICHVDGMVMAHEYGVMNEAAEALARAFWPGPLTLVVPKSSGSRVHDLVTAGLDTVGLRCPKGFARRVISALGRPLAAPSANRSGRLSPTTAQHVAAEYPGSDLLILDGGPCPVGLESTIVKVTGDRLTLLRPGAISAEEIAEATGLTVSAAAAEAGIEAPGMLESHYAPDTPVIVNQAGCPQGAAFLSFGTHPVPANAATSLNLSPDSNLVEAAANLYAYLKRLDAEGAPAICVAPVPEEALGLAINDRLRRAAAPRNAAAVTERAR